MSLHPRGQIRILRFRSIGRDRPEPLHGEYELRGGLFSDLITGELMAGG